jgi:thiamine biosynthesis protein ThiI
MTGTTTLHVTLSGDVFLKSRQTQKRLIKRALANLEQALGSVGYDGHIKRIGTHRFQLEPTDAFADDVRSVARTVFGFASVDTVRSIAFDGIEDLARTVGEITASSVKGRTFAARVKRRGVHEWNSMDLARLIGSELYPESAGVDLSHPEEEVHVTVLDQRAFLVIDHAKAAGGLPIGTQDRVLCLVSGGFDSVVAAWMLMSRGCPVDFVHFSLNCAQSDHALAVARELWTRWGHGTDPTVHLVEFQPVKDALIEHVDARMRQVTLKVMMARAASEIAEDARVMALVTGDALGQVSSQTLPHLVAVSKSSDVPILRPLLGLPKESIIDLARIVGTAELSARALEVCDLSGGGPVATAASEAAISETIDQIPDDVLTHVVETRKTFDLKDWTPGQV